MRPRSWALNRLTLIPAITICCLLAATLALAHGDTRPQKTGILLVAFGTTMPEADAAYKNIEKRVREAFPDIPLRWAYTSKKVCRKLADAGVIRDSPATALARMMDEDFTHATVLSLHVIPGEEYHSLVQTAHAFEGLPKGLQKVLVTWPLLGGPDDLPEAASALMSMVPAERRADEAVIFMGHGTHHPGNAFYPAMQYYLERRDKLAFVGTVEGSPSLMDVITGLGAAKVKKAYMIPFMAVAGDHACNDMAGEEADSWKSILSAGGIEAVPVLRGAGEFDPVVDIWIKHLKGALEHFGK